MLKKYAHRPDKRLLLLWATSAGKSLGAISAAQQLRAKRILAVAPAVGRGTWLAQFEKWAKEYDPRAIRLGLGRTSGVTKAEKAYRDEAYGAEVQIISYGLLSHLEPRRYDLIILDEFHALRSPLSKQSKNVRRFFALNSATPALGLSATGIPTDPKQIWNPLNTFWPGQWGFAQPTGDVSWKFQAMYCEKHMNEYGTQYKGAKSPEALEDLARRLDPYVHRVSDREVAEFLPPLHAEALHLDQNLPMAAVAVDWLEGLPATVSGKDGAEHRTQPIIICFKHDTAAELAEMTGGILMGRISPEARVRLLADAAEQGVPVIATSESIRESISLTAYTHALIFEWRTSPAQAIQLIGRFARQDASDLLRPTFVQYVTFPGDATRAGLLQERVEAVSVVMQKDSKAERLQEIFAPQELTDERIEKLMLAMLGRQITVSDEEYVPEDEAAGF